MPLPPESRIGANHRSTALALLAATVVVGATARAQDTIQPHAPPPPAESPPAEPQPALPSPQVNPTSPRDASADPTAIFRAPLIREGSAITDAVAQIEREDNRGTWTVLIKLRDAKLPPQVLTLLPCTQLSQMEHIVQATPDRIVQFQVSGKVFVFRGRNYLLATYAPVLPQEASAAHEANAAAHEANTAAHEAGAAAGDQPANGNEAPSVNQSNDPGSDPPPAAADSNTAPDGEDSQRAADIMRDLERAAGPMPRSGAPAPVAAPGGRARPSSDEGDANKKLLPEETQLVSRRGKITRDSGGGWMFVFDADASGLADPPLRLLPCLLLERIEDYARRTGNNSPALLSGPVYLYGGENYLLPTVFRIPAERRNITP